MPNNIVKYKPQVKTFFMILKHFEKYSDKYIEHLINMQNTASEKDKEAIEVALYHVAHYKELNTLLSEQLRSEVSIKTLL